MPADLTALENLFLGLADKTRLRLLGLMAAGPVSVGHLVSETGESQPKISRHLAYLRNAGLVDTTRDGKWVYYGLVELDDVHVDSIYQCVVGELSNEPRATTPARNRGRRISADKADTQIADRNVGDGYVSNDISDLDDTDERLEWTHPSEGHREELDVFLL